MTKEPFTGDFRESLMLWLPTGDGEVNSQELDNFFISRQAIEDFMTLKISPQTYINTLYDCGIEIDSYLEDVNHNLLYL